jgi:hypothetical protein
VGVGLRCFFSASLLKLHCFFVISVEVDVEVGRI